MEDNLNFSKTKLRKIISDIFFAFYKCITARWILLRNHRPDTSEYEKYYLSHWGVEWIRESGRVNTFKLPTKFTTSVTMRMVHMLCAIMTFMSTGSSPALSCSMLRFARRSKGLELVQFHLTTRRHNLLLLGTHPLELGQRFLKMSP